MQISNTGSRKAQVVLWIIKIVSEVVNSMIAVVLHEPSS